MTLFLVSFRLLSRACALTCVTSAECRNRAEQIYEICIENCASKISKTTSEDFIKAVSTSKYAHIYSELWSRHSYLPLTIKWFSVVPSAPSPCIMKSLMNLIQAVENHGCFDDFAQRWRIAKSYLRSFTSTLVIALKTCEKPLSTQSVWDLNFLKAICDSWGSEFSGYIAELDSVINMKKVRRIKAGDINHSSDNEKGRWHEYTRCTTGKRHI